MACIEDYFPQYMIRICEKCCLAALVLLFTMSFLTNAVFYSKQHIVVTYFHADVLAKTVINNSDNCYKWKLMIGRVQLCIHTKILALKSGYLWYQIPDIVEFCGRSLRKQLKTKLLHNKDDTKGFIDFVDERSKSDCTLVTIGIGGDIQAEKQLRKRLPKCKMYGADPVNASGHLYNQVGKYYQFAISDKTALKNTSILKNPSDIFNYTTEVVQHVSLTDFLQLINVSVVDYMFLDGEGSEYQILPLLWHSTFLQNHNISICQLSVELHGPTVDYNLPTRKWETFMKTLLFTSNYVPLWTPPRGNHHRMFLINSEDQNCIDRFFRHFC